MPDLFDLIAHWWKRIIIVVILCVVVVGVITFLKPRKYLSVATAVPASSFNADRSRIFNENIQALYSTLGTPDDLDMIVGTGNLDTVYWAVAQQFNLWDHYKMKEKGDAAVRKAASLLKANAKVMKSEYGELKVKVWDTDKNLAAELANAIMDVLQSIHSNLQAVGNKTTLNGLVSARKKIMIQADSLADKTKLIEQSQQYDKLINEYQVMVDSKLPALVVVERAKPTDWPDRPRRKQILIATAFLSFLFALLAALVMERRKLPLA